MTVEVLFDEVCSQFGDRGNSEILRAAMPEANFVYTTLLEEPYFVSHDVDMLLLGSMEESIQRRVIEKLRPYRDRLIALVDAGVPFLATGNAGEIFAKEIHYVTEKLDVEGLNLFDIRVETDWFKRYNGKVIGSFADFKIVGYRSQFSLWYGDNSNGYFFRCDKGIGMNRDTMLEGLRRKNLICTSIIGPLLPLNPLFCEYFMGLAGVKAQVPFRETAMEAFRIRQKHFENPKMMFSEN